MRKRVFAWILVVLWLGLVIYLSCQDATESSALSGWIAKKIILGLSYIRVEVDYGVLHAGLRELAHFAVHMILMIFMYRAIRLSIGVQKPSIIACVVLGISLALFDEYIQKDAIGRSLEFCDVILNFSGAMFGTIIGILSFRKE